MKDSLVIKMLDDIVKDVTAGKYVESVISEQIAKLNILSNVDEMLKKNFFNGKLAVYCDDKQKLDRLVVFSEEESPLKVIYDETFYHERSPYAVIVYGDDDYMHFVTWSKCDFINCDIKTISFEDFAGISRQH